jgi:hypothetical protein
MRLYFLVYRVLIDFGNGISWFLLRFRATSEMQFRIGITSVHMGSAYFDISLSILLLKMSLWGGGMPSMTENRVNTLPNHLHQFICTPTFFFRTWNRYAAFWLWRKNEHWCQFFFLQSLHSRWSLSEKCVFIQNHIFIIGDAYWACQSHTSRCVGVSTLDEKVVCLEESSFYG